MIDIDKLEALAKAADSGIWAMGQSIIETNGGVIECTRDNYDTHDENMQFVAAANPAAILALVAEVRALREDAARYQWLRQGKPFWVKVPVKDKHVEYFVGHKPEPKFPGCFDAAIDAERAKEQA